jgi:hypothetical protein
MTIVYWLVLVVTNVAGNSHASGSSMLHVGNFSSINDCRAAGEAAISSKLQNVSSSVIGPAYFICVQANDGKVAAPE